MKKLVVPIRIVFYRDGVDWVAHCLEFDLMGDGPDHTIALRGLIEAMSMQIDASMENDNPDNLFKPAEGKFFRMFFEGNEVAWGHVHVESDWLTIDTAMVREYAEPSKSRDPNLALG
jgi:hypothetical protein